MYVHDLIVDCSTAFLKRQNEDGSFLAGHNGPYYDEELPVRNTAHVMMLLLKAFSINNNHDYLLAARRAAEYVSDDARRPMGANYWSRKNPPRDFSNGVIGPAWIIEALVYASSFFEDLDLAGLAEKVFLLHPFNEKEGVWKSVNVDGSHGPVDDTFNHQLWFAAAGSTIIGDSEVSRQITVFMNNLDRNLQVYKNGLIVHGMRPRAVKQVARNAIRFARRNARKRSKPWDIARRLFLDALEHARGDAYTDAAINKAIAYHAFNTYGFSLLHDATKAHPFWRSNKFRMILSFIESGVYSKGLDVYVIDKEPDGLKLPFSKYGYAYNPVGVEVAYTAQVFPKHFTKTPEEMTDCWLNRQLENTFNRDTGFMENNADDPATLAARMYELVRVNNYKLT